MQTRPDATGMKVNLKCSLVLLRLAKSESHQDTVNVPASLAQARDTEVDTGAYDDCEVAVEEEWC